MHCGYHQVNKHRILRNEMYKGNQMWRASERERTEACDQPHGKIAK